ncbi:MAG: LuxR C-terminal-related transcriptional regulator [Candidatus Korobacteraceae bacterium]
MRPQTSPSIRVLVVDSTRVHTELLADALKRDECLQVTSLPPDSDRLKTDLNPSDADVLLISSNLEGQSGRGFELLRALRSVRPDLRAIVLLDSSQGEMILKAFRAGAQGIFSKSDSVETLGKCIRKVYEGQIWANTHQVATLTEALASSHHIRAVDARGLNLLSKREMEVVRGVALGLSNREIAERLQLSQHTIKNCLFRIFDKLGVSSRVELLFMTLSQEGNAQSALQHFLNGRAHESLRDEASLVACRNAACRGILIAQIALAQYYALNKAVPNSAVQAYVWYSTAAAQVSQACGELAKELTIEQLLDAEQMATERSSKSGEASVTGTERRRPVRRTLGHGASRTEHPSTPH